LAEFNITCWFFWILSRYTASACSGNRPYICRGRCPHRP